MNNENFYGRMYEVLSGGETYEGVARDVKLDESQVKEVEKGLKKVLIDSHPSDTFGIEYIRAEERKMVARGEIDAYKHIFIKMGFEGVVDNAMANLFGYVVSELPVRHTRIMRDSYAGLRSKDVAELGKSLESALIEAKPSPLKNRDERNIAAATGKARVYEDFLSKYGQKEVVKLAKEKAKMEAR